MKGKTLVTASLIGLLFCSGGCNNNMTAVQKRQQKLEKKKRHNPNDCPKLDC
jgi:hypothetical protein